MKQNYGGVIFGWLLVYICLPVLTFCCGWLGGWILKLVISVPVVDGLNTLFGTTRFTPETIPVVCGILATIGSHFKTVNSSSK